MAAGRQCVRVNSPVIRHQIQVYVIYLFDNGCSELAWKLNHNTEAIALRIFR
jgi:hypothetical protein